MTPEDLRARLLGAGLESYVDALLDLARPAVRLRSAPARADDLPTGTSKLGGRPDLPQPLQWPEGRKGLLSFVVQVNLAEINAFAVDGPLPSSGMLSFFYGVRQGAWGFDPEDRGGWSVIYTPPGEPLVRHDTPDGVRSEERFKLCALRPEAETTFAPSESADVEALGLTFDERIAYGDALGDEDPPVHRLLGHANPIQGDMQLECQLVSYGLYCGDDTGYDDPRAAILAPGAQDWRLLMQIDSDDHAEMMWGDLGRIYYWMRNEDLAAGAWEGTWLVLQCM